MKHGKNTNFLETQSRKNCCSSSSNSSSERIVNNKMSAKTLILIPIAECREYVIIQFNAEFVSNKLKVI